MKNTTLNWQIRGSAVMRFLGLKVYDIQLETTSAWADHEFATNPLRMKLTYAMKLEGSLIAERSLIEMRRFAKISSQQSMQWLALMQSAFPNVQKGDSLIGEADGAGNVQFWHNDKPTASYNDPDFARLFFGVWLDEKTSAPAIRASLLGKA